VAEAPGPASRFPPAAQRARSAPLSRPARPVRSVPSVQMVEIDQALSFRPGRAGMIPAGLVLPG